jgi:hypothetical protein
MLVSAWWYVQPMIGCLRKNVSAHTKNSIRTARSSSFGKSTLVCEDEVAEEKENRNERGSGGETPATTINIILAFAPNLLQFFHGSFSVPQLHKI